MKFVIPFGVFVILVVFLAAGLRHDPREIPSPLLGKSAPAFRLTQLHEPDKSFSPEQMRGKVWLLNVWASWCASCRTEHPLLMALSRAGIVPIYGLDYKDTREHAIAFLDTLSNPYTLSIQDADGRVGIDYGVYGVPETYLIDKNGVIRFKRIGPLSLDILEKTVLPLIEKLNQ
jgi:cytochrome c biogenesis protein CcmG/thiol:disulfide interchange protein DsbE